MSEGVAPSQSPSPAMPGPIPLTLIVACSPKNGIGKGGTLPWRLKREMAYFKQVTSACGLGLPPPHPESGDSSSLTNDISRKNFLIMGRNTWESIPPKFRPLAGRVNVVISRTADASSLGIDASTDSHLSSSISEASGLLAYAQESGQKKSSPRAFLIGGAQLYNHFLRNPT
ncbi:dihydrofolate reductase, partial [Tilletiaria anomala UBC 951]